MDKEANPMRDVSQHPIDSVSKNPSVSVHLGCCNGIPQIEWLINSKFWRLGSPRVC